MKTHWLILGLIAAFVLWATCAACNVAGQRKLIYADGNEELYDYWMPRMCLEQGYASMGYEAAGLDRDQKSVRGYGLLDGHVWVSDWYQTRNGMMFLTGDQDKVYPALALLPFKLFPASRGGGYVWSALAGLVLLGSLVVVAKGRWWVIALACSMPFVYNLERGNPVWLSAALCGVFLAWWNDMRPWRRWVAAACLAAAAVLKIAPVVLGLVYVAEAVVALRRRDYGAVRTSVSMAVLSGLIAIVLFVVPWYFLPEGLSAVPTMIANAAAHCERSLRGNDFGLLPVWRTIRMMLGQDVMSPWTGMMAAVRLTQLLGLAAVVYGAFRRDALLLAGGMLMIPGNMFYYAAVYLLAPFVLSVSEGRRLPVHEALLWFVVFCPVQAVLMGRSGNAVLCNCAMLVLMALHVARGLGRKVERA